MVYQENNGASSLIKRGPKKKVVHWRREWQTTPAFLPGEPHEQYEKARG